MQEGQDPTGVDNMPPADDFDNDVTDAVTNSSTVDGQAAENVFHSKNIGKKATTEYFSNVKGGKKNQDKVERRRSRNNKKVLTIILGIIIAILVVIMTIFLILNLTNRSGRRTHEELPTTITEVRQRTYKKAYEAGAYYDGLNYLINLIQDMEDSDIDKTFVFEVKIFMLRFLSEAGDPSTAIEMLQGLESETLTDMQKYWLYNACVDIFRQEGDEKSSEEYAEKLKKLDANSSDMNFSTALGSGGEDE